MSRVHGDTSATKIAANIDKLKLQRTFYDYKSLAKSTVTVKQSNRGHKKNALVNKHDTSL